MKYLPLVSVILPFYNEKQYLNKSIGTLINQTYNNKEIIVIDDGSTDGSLKTAKKYPVRIITQGHQGSGAARNLGVKNAKGEILIFADADMSFDKNYIAQLIQPILSKQAIGTFTTSEFVANSNNIWSRCWSINSNLPVDRRLPVDYPGTENAFRAILRDYFIKAGGFETDEGYTDDSSVSKKLKIKAINAEGAICYHYNPSNLPEVFISARWIGRSKLFRPDFKNALRFSFVNSLRVGMKYFFRGAPLAVFFFKLVYDGGMFAGIFLSNGKTYK